MHQIKDISKLKKLLWLDFFLGSSTAIIGLVFSDLLSPALGLNSSLILVIATITLLYSIVAFTLAKQKTVSVLLLRTLINANWFWTIVSVVLLYLHFKNATALGLVFLILQIIVVGGLAYLEENKIVYHNQYNHGK